MPYPVSVSIEPAPIDRNRLTTAFRLVLAIPHVLLVGGVGFGFAVRSGVKSSSSLGGETGLLGTVAIALVIVSWLTIVITGEHYTPIRRYTRFYLRWRVRSLSYLMLLTDHYPPFGDEPYPAALTFDAPDKPHDRVTVFFRFFLAIPHYFVLFGVLCIWWVTTVLSWTLILITGRSIPSLMTFGAGALRWLIRVEAYSLLLLDDYPPFSLD